MKLFPDNVRRIRACKWVCKVAQLTLAGVIILFISACSSKKDSSTPYIKTAAELNEVLENAGKKLIILDFYADWCGPCKMLDPILKEIVKSHAGKVSLYKIDIDRNQQLAIDYGARSIPHIVFVKNKETVATVMGLQPSRVYIEVIMKYAE